MALLSDLWGDDIAIAWRCLCYRPYVVPPSMRVVPLVSEVVFTDAARGAVNVGYLYDMPSSPSPASSLLCLTKAQRKWFPDYALLGDDLVIGNIRVAKQYRKLVRRLGVEISEAKSLRSRNGSMEFASRFILEGRDLSPVSFKLLDAARRSTARRSFSAEFRQILQSEFFRVLGAGYRVLARCGVSYQDVATLPTKWFRIWLLIHHPRSSFGLPWLWWLSAGRGFIVPAIGVRNYRRPGLRRCLGKDGT